MLTWRGVAPGLKQDQLGQTSVPLLGPIGLVSPCAAPRSFTEMDETWLPAGAARPGWLVGWESAGPPWSRVPSPTGHTVALDKSVVFCLGKSGSWTKL